MLALLLSGCTLLGSSNPIEGIWVFYVSPDATFEGTSDCSENYNDGECPSAGGGGDSEWTVNSSFEADEDTFVAQVVGGTGRNTALMFWNGTVLDGVRNDAGLWVFTYENFADGTTEQVHDAGYRIEEQGEVTTNQRLVLDVAMGGNATGDLEANGIQRWTWTESDEWDPTENNVYDSQIDQSWGWLGAENMFSDDDCSGELCQLSVESNTTVSAPVRGVLTDLRDVADFDALESYGDYDGLDTGI